MENNQRIQLIADSKIPFLKGVFEPSAIIHYLDPHEINSESVKEVDGLIIRTRTHCNEALLKNSAIKMIATATIGYDHIDATYCEEHGIKWKSAPGCNAESVAQYVLSCLLLISKNRHIPVQELRVGIVGVGNVGKAVESLLNRMKIKTRRCDPPRAKAEPEETFYTLDEIGAWADVITFHTPLIKDGDTPTFHLADKNFFETLERTPAIINSARGEVVDEFQLKLAKTRGYVNEVIMDCWANEPTIDQELLAQCLIATPHIAGYSADGKANATRMACQAIATHFDLSITLQTVEAPRIEPSQIDMRMHSIEEALLLTYNPEEDFQRLRSDIEGFEQQRGSYPLRREYRAYTLTHVKKEEAPFYETLGFNCILEEELAK